MAKQKPVRKKASKKSPKKPSAKVAIVVDASAELDKLGFFRGEYHWEQERHVSALDSRVKLNVDHVNGLVTPEQVRAVEWLLESEKALRPPAVKAAYECMLKWVEGYRERHPEFRGKPIAERPFTRGCELKSALFPAPGITETKPAPVFVLSLFWPDDNRPCEVRFERLKGKWVVAACERN